MYSSTMTSEIRQPSAITDLIPAIKRFAFEEHFGLDEDTLKQLMIYEFREYLMTCAISGVLVSSQIAAA